MIINITMMPLTYAEIDILCRWYTKHYTAVTPFYATGVPVVREDYSAQHLCDNSAHGRYILNRVYGCTVAGNSTNTVKPIRVLQTYTEYIVQPTTTNIKVYAGIY